MSFHGLFGTGHFTNRTLLASIIAANMANPGLGVFGPGTPAQEGPMSLGKVTLIPPIVSVFAFWPWGSSIASSSGRRWL